MGNSKISKIYNEIESDCYYVDILYSVNCLIEEKKNKILIFENDYLVLRGINTIYKRIPYEKIESWTVNIKGKTITFNTNSKELICLKCKKIVEARKDLYKHIVNSMINMNYSQEKINDACKKFNMEEIFLI